MHNKVVCRNETTSHCIYDFLFFMGVFNLSEE